MAEAQSCLRVALLLGGGWGGLLAVGISLLSSLFLLVFACHKRAPPLSFLARAPSCIFGLIGKLCTGAGIRRQLSTRAT
jgi:hypothetical protein